MGNTFEITFKTILADYLCEEYGWDVSEVISYKQEDRGYSSGCHTCDYDEIVVEVTFLTPEGKRESRDLYATFAELLEDLIRFDEAR